MRCGEGKPGASRGAWIGGEFSVKFLRFQSTVVLWYEGGAVNDSVAVDAKRILLRYGAPIAILDSVSEDDRIRFARLIARTTLPEREIRLKELLQEGGYLEEETKGEA